VSNRLKITGRFAGSGNQALAQITRTFLPGSGLSRLAANISISLCLFELAALGDAISYLDKDLAEIEEEYGVSPEALYRSIKVDTKNNTVTINSALFNSLLQPVVDIVLGGEEQDRKTGDKK